MLAKCLPRAICVWCCVWIRSLCCTMLSACSSTILQYVLWVTKMESRLLSVQSYFIFFTFFTPFTAGAHASYAIFKFSVDSSICVCILFRTEMCSCACVHLCVMFFSLSFYLFLLLFPLFHAYHCIARRVLLLDAMFRLLATHSHTNSTIAWLCRFLCEPVR